MFFKNNMSLVNFLIDALECFRCNENPMDEFIIWPKI